MKDEVLIAKAKRVRSARSRLASEDINVFVPFVLRHERTGKRIQQAPYHCRLQNFLNNHDRAVVWGHVEMGKTQQVSVARPLFELGNDFRKRLVVIQNTAFNAKKVVRSVKWYIEHSEEYRRVFPRIRPGEPWTGQAIRVCEEGSEDPPGRDYSLQVAGVKGIANVLGNRIDGLILDDILTIDNTLSAYMRKQVLHQIESVLLGRMTQDAWIWFLGNAWHPEDAMHELAKRPGWYARTFTVDYPDGTPRWPEQWSNRRISRKEDELGGAGSVEAERQLRCRARSESDSRFSEDDIYRCRERGLGLWGDRGLQLLAFDDSNPCPLGAAAFTAVDLGVKRTKKSNLTSFFHMLKFSVATRAWGVDFEPNDLLVLCIETGKWKALPILKRIYASRDRYGSKIRVESNAAQEHVRDLGEELSELFTGKHIEVEPFETSSKKHHPQFGIEGVSATMAQGKFVMASLPVLRPDGSPATDERGRPVLRSHPEVEAWILEMLYYDPAGHTGDRLMSSWFAWDGARGYSFRGHRVEIAGPAEPVFAEVPVEAGPRSQDDLRAVQRERLWGGLLDELGMDGV